MLAFFTLQAHTYSTSCHPAHLRQRRHMYVCMHTPLPSTSNGRHGGRSIQGVQPHCIHPAQLAMWLNKDHILEVDSALLSNPIICHPISFHNLPSSFIPFSPSPFPPSHPLSKDLVGIQPLPITWYGRALAYIATTTQPRLAAVPSPG